ncbi:hypothetical protein LTR08_003389 [Meristemomyces frigidus]|nr:hypothetical protein LTR08_003389 [Meristemomyces frigidus]
MSAVNNSEPTSKSAAKRKKKSKKKANGKVQALGEVAAQNGVNHERDHDADEDEEEDEGIDSPRKASIPSHVRDEDTLHMPSSPPGPLSPVLPDEPPVQNGAQQHLPEAASDLGDATSNHDEEQDEPPQAPEQSVDRTVASSDTTARLDAMQQERDALRDEVSQLRQNLESLQEQHSTELSGVKGELEQTQQGKDHAETQYRNLLGKVNTIRSQLGERLKQDAEELEQARGKIEELESEKATAQSEAQADSERLQERVSGLQSQLEKQESEIEQQDSEIQTLRSRTNLSTSNWAKERDDMASKEAYIREEYEVARQAMQDWEILATEERSRREALEERIADLEEQLSGSREAYEKVRGDVDMQSSTVDGLQRALREVQDERKRELRELVGQSQAQLDELRKHAKFAEDSASELKQQLESTKKELDRALPFEREVKEKNLLIGKLRHEAVTLNDHLTKALRFLKRGKPEDNVDRQLVTNHFLHFLALDRSDPKKFQILQLTAALLGWDEQQKEQAGLLRAGSLSGALRLPLSPFRRSPSTPSLGADFVPESPGGASRESLAELWSDFLEREAEAGGGSSRRGSLANSMRSPSMTSQTGLGGSSARRESPDVRRTDGQSAGNGGAGVQSR